MGQAIYPMTIFYDASCPLCNAEMHNLMLRNTEDLLQFVDASEAGFESPLQGVTQANLMNLIHARCADGRVVKGVEVFRLAYGAVGMGWLTAPTAWPVLKQMADRAYPWVVRHRYRFPRWLVHALFEGPTRRAAERAASRARCNDSQCRAQ